MAEHMQRTNWKKFSLYSWVLNIPLCDDVFLSMQAQNIAVVDMMVIRDLEAAVIERFYADDQMPMDLVQLLSGLSQMWIYYLYEFLRTWRERARKLLSAAEEYAAQNTPEKKEAVLKKHVDEIAERQKLSLIQFPFQTEEMNRIDNAHFIARVRAYFDETDGLFRSAEALRVTLAKHEVPKTGKYRLLAEAPGYGRVDQLTGSMYWFFNLKDGTVDRVDRRTLANDFLYVTDTDPVTEKAEFDSSEKPKHKKKASKKKRA